MEDHIILHKNIIDDWKFKDEGVLKFWILLLVEELEAQKDKDGLFVIKNISQMAKTAGLERRKATRVIKRMEQDKTITLFFKHHNPNEPKFSNVNSNIKTKILIKREATIRQNAKASAMSDAKASAKASAMSVTDLKVNIEADNTCFQKGKMPRQVPRLTPMFSIEPKDLEYLKWIEEFESENANPDTNSSIDTETSNEPDNLDFEQASPPMFPPNPFDNFSESPNPEIKPPPTKEEEERIARRIALRSVLKEEIGYLFYNETVNSFFNELSKEYDGSPDKEIQLAVRKNLLRKIYGSFEDTLEIKKAELYAENKDNPIILSPRTRVLCSTYLDREFLKISKNEKVQYDEQKMIKINTRGPRKVGDVVKEIVANFSAKVNAKSTTDLKTGNEATESNSESDKTPSQAPNSPDATILTESDPSNQVGTELAKNTINTIKNSESTCTKILSTVQENNLNNFVLDKRGCGGEKGENFVAETPTENLPVEKISKVAENHPDGRPAFSTKAFKSLPRAKQIQIIGERLSEIAEMFPTIDVEFQFDHWKDWMDAKGQSFKDYSAAFRNWLRKSLDFAAKNSASNPTKIYTETGAKFVTQEVFTNPAHVPFKKDVPRNPNMKRRPGIGGVE